MFVLKVCLESWKTKPPFLNLPYRIPALSQAIFNLFRMSFTALPLIKILYYKYHAYSNLYLTWDCASWH